MPSYDERVVARGLVHISPWWSEVGQPEHSRQVEPTNLEASLFLVLHYSVQKSCTVIIFFIMSKAIVEIFKHKLNV